LIFFIVSARKITGISLRSKGYFSTICGIYSRKHTLIRLLCEGLFGLTGQAFFLQRNCETWQLHEEKWLIPDPASVPIGNSGVFSVPSGLRINAFLASEIYNQFN